MDKFTDKLYKFDERKYTNKVKNDIYAFIKEHIGISIDGDANINGNADITLDGVDELTDVLYNYIQQEKTKQEILTLEQIKLNVAVGNFDMRGINEHIESLNEKVNYK
jgi:hypothetical protein